MVVDHAHGAAVAVAHLAIVMSPSIYNRSAQPYLTWLACRITSTAQRASRMQRRIQVILSFLAVVG